MKAIIVEDEIAAQQELNWLIGQHSNLIIVDKIFDDGLDVLKYLQHNKVDVIFLDIRLPTLDGMLLAQNINKFAKKPLIVFISAYQEHAVEAFEVEAFDYILKPWQEIRMATMLQKLEKLWEQQESLSQNVSSLRFYSRYKTMNLIKNERFIVTNISDICYVEAHKKMTFIYTIYGEEYIMPISISKFCMQLPLGSFFRCHRSYCVNMRHIIEIEPWFNHTYILQLREQKIKVPVSRSKVKEFRKIMRL
ncbi:MAG: LytTR family DNA-binding domain-containing protein [Candidatus Dasytiphilus stammeri]